MGKDQDQDKFDGAIASKFIQLISMTAFTSVGVWMVLSPGGLEHSSVEKGSVYIFKEIWSLEAGIIILAIAIPFMVLTIMKYLNFRKNIWYKDNAGYYLYINKKRSSGNHSLYQGKTLLVFHPDSGNVYKLKNYEKSKVGKFYTALPASDFSCDKVYWRAGKNGFNLFYKGRKLDNISSKYDQDDLFVKASDIRKNFKLTNYRNRQDNVIREAEELN